MLLDGRYRIEKKLAAGGFGAIYRATHVPSGNVVALKVLHADIASDRHLSARFRREAAALASLRDQHTVTTYDHGEAADGTLFIAMELLGGRSLFDELHANGRVPWRRMLSIMRGVCSSLVEAHAHGIVHRDLKPANIHLETRDGEHDFVKVLDFGIAKLLEGSDVDDDSELTRIGQAIGTLEYMSPEQIVGDEIDGRSDLYALGVVAYELITGSRPFADATGPASTMTALMTRTPTPPSMLISGGLPAEVDALLLRCLARDPQDRFVNAGALAAAIDEILTPISFLTTLRGPAPAARRPLRSTPSAQFAPGVSATLAASALGDDGDDTVVEAIPPRATWEPTARPLSLPLPPPRMSEPKLRAMPKLQPRPLPQLQPMPEFQPMPELPTPEVTPARPHSLSRLPMLNTPPELAGYRANARGSSVGPLPTLPKRHSAAKLAVWGLALLASGLGIGALVSAL